jgi:hypothetical protein
VVELGFAVVGVRRWMLDGFAVVLLVVVLDGLLGEEGVHCVLGRGIGEAFRSRDEVVVWK